MNKRPTWCHLLFYFTDTTPTLPHRNSHTHRTKNNTTNVVIQQNSRKLLMMDILMSETCWTHKKWNKIASDIKLVFYSWTIIMMHGPINIRYIAYVFSLALWDQAQVTLHLQSFRLSVQTLSWSALVPGGGGVTFFSGTRSHSQRPYGWFVATAYFPFFFNDNTLIKMCFCT